MLATPIAHAVGTVHIAHLVPVEKNLQPNPFCFAVRAPVIYLSRSVSMPAPLKPSTHRTTVRAWAVGKVQTAHTPGHAVQASLAGPAWFPIQVCPAHEVRPSGPLHEPLLPFGSIRVPLFRVHSSML